MRRASVHAALGCTAGIVPHLAAAILGDDLSLPSSVTAGGASGPEAALAAVLYLGRHALLYLALQRWAFQWDARWWAVESDQ